MKVRLAFSLALLFLVAACQNIPKNAFKLTSTSLEERRLQTRLFHTDDELSLLSAGVAVLQDMGYSIDETEKEVGLISASKTVDATDGKQIAAAVFLALLGGRTVAVDDKQKIKVSLITRPSGLDSKGYLARITFQRVVWNTQGNLARVESIKDKELYEQFFDKLSKSVFLEANKI